MSYERLNVDAAAESSWTLKAEFPSIRDADADVDFDDDDDDDDEYVREYRARRLAEMHAASNAPTYGEVVDTTRERFVADVTEPSSSGYVVVCMTRKGYAAIARCLLSPAD